MSDIDDDFDSDIEDFGTDVEDDPPADTVGSDTEDTYLNDDSDVEDDFDEFQGIDNVESQNTLHKDVIIVEPDKRKTSNVMSNYELTEAITIRACQLQKRFIQLTDVEGLTDPKEMAIKELKDGKSPLTLRRKVGEVVKNGRLTEYYEFWDVNNMTKIW